MLLRHAGLERARGASVSVVAAITRLPVDALGARGPVDIDRLLHSLEVREKLLLRENHLPERHVHNPRLVAAELNLPHDVSKKPGGCGVSACYAAFENAAGRELPREGGLPVHCAARRAFPPLNSVTAFFRSIVTVPAFGFGMRPRGPRRRPRRAT